MKNVELSLQVCEGQIGGVEVKWVPLEVRSQSLETRKDLNCIACQMICCHCLVNWESGSFSTPCSVVYQAPLSVGFPRQEYESRLRFSSPRNLLESAIEPTSPALAGGFFYHWATREAPADLAWFQFSLNRKSLGCFGQLLNLSSRMELHKYWRANSCPGLHCGHGYNLEKELFE